MPAYLPLDQAKFALEVTGSTVSWDLYIECVKHLLVKVCFAQYTEIEYYW